MSAPAPRPAQSGSHTGCQCCLASFVKAPRSHLTRVRWSTRQELQVSQFKLNTSLKIKFVSALTTTNDWAVADSSLSKEGTRLHCRPNHRHTQAQCRTVLWSMPSGSSSMRSSLRESPLLGSDQTDHPHQVRSLTSQPLPSLAGVSFGILTMPSPQPHMWGNVVAKNLRYGLCLCLLANPGIPLP